MRKEYSINELANILGCSRTAITKKIKTDENNPGVERYKNRYDVVISNGIKAILLDEQELEAEKACSRGFKTVTNNGYNKAINEDVIDIESEKEKISAVEVLNFTQSYISELKTFQETTYNELRNLASERDTYKNQVLLLEDSENRKESALHEALSENMVLKKRNTMLTVILGIITLVLACFITFYVTYKTAHQTVIPPDNTIEPQKVQEIKKEVVQEVKTPQTTSKRK